MILSHTYPNATDFVYNTLKYNYDSLLLMVCIYTVLLFLFFEEKLEEEDYEEESDNLYSMFKDKNKYLETALDIIEELVEDDFTLYDMYDIQEQDNEEYINIIKDGYSMVECDNNFPLFFKIENKMLYVKFLTERKTFDYIIVFFDSRNEHDKNIDNLMDKFENKYTVYCYMLNGDSILKLHNHKNGYRFLKCKSMFIGGKKVC